MLEEALLANEAVASETGRDSLHAWYEGWSPKLLENVLRQLMERGLTSDWGFSAAWGDKTLSKRDWLPSSPGSSRDERDDRWIRGLLLWTNAETFRRGSLALAYGAAYCYETLGSLGSPGHSATVIAKTEGKILTVLTFTHIPNEHSIF